MKSCGPERWPKSGQLQERRDLKLVTKNWHEFQHYKDRNPTWIKLHKSLLDNYEFQCLPIASKALAPMLWLIASEHERGEIDATYEKLAFRLRITKEQMEEGLGPLIGNGFFEVLAFDPAPASKPLAECKQVAIPENINIQLPTEKTLSADADYAGGFVGFWEAWPKTKRKQGKFKAWKLWRSMKLEPLAERIIAHVEVMKTSAHWLEGFDPLPITYLNGRLWEDGVPVKHGGLATSVAV